MTLRLDILENDLPILYRESCNYIYLIIHIELNITMFQLYDALHKFPYLNTQYYYNGNGILECQCARTIHLYTHFSNNKFQ